MDTMHVGKQQLMVNKNKLDDSERYFDLLRERLPVFIKVRVRVIKFSEKNKFCQFAKTTLFFFRYSFKSYFSF